MCRRSHSISRYKSRLMDPKDHVHMHSSTSIPLSHSRHEEVRALRAVYLSGTLGTPTWPMYGGKKFPLTSKVPRKHRTSDTEDTRHIINPSCLISFSGTSFSSHSILLQAYAEHGGLVLGSELEQRLCASAGMGRRTCRVWTTVLSCSTAGWMPSG